MPTPSRTGTASQINASSDGSTSVTVPADCTGIIAFFCGWENVGGSGQTGLTLNGVAFTQLQNATVGGGSGTLNAHRLCYLESPATGSQTVAWTDNVTDAWDEGGELVLVYLKDVNIGDAVRASGADRDESTNAVQIAGMATASDDLVLVFAECFQTSTPAITSASTTFINNANFNSQDYDVAEYPPGASSVTIDMTGEEYSTMMAVSLKASAAAAGQPTAKRFGGIAYVAGNARSGRDGGQVWMPERRLYLPVRRKILKAA